MCVEVGRTRGQGLTARPVLNELEKGEVTEKTRQLYALKAFEHTADYDEAISGFFRKKYAGYVYFRVTSITP